MAYTMIINVSGHEQSSDAPIFPTSQEARAALLGALLYHLEWLQTRCPANHPIVDRIQRTIADLKARPLAEIEAEGYRVTIPADTISHSLPTLFYLLPVKDTA